MLVTLILKDLIERLLDGDPERNFERRRVLAEVDGVDRLARDAPIGEILLPALAALEAQSGESCS